MASRNSKECWLATANTAAARLFFSGLAIFIRWSSSKLPRSKGTVPCSGACSEGWTYLEGRKTIRLRHHYNNPTGLTKTWSQVQRWLECTGAWGGGCTCFHACVRVRVGAQYGVVLPSFLVQSCVWPCGCRSAISTGVSGRRVLHRPMGWVSREARLAAQPLAPSWFGTHAGGAGEVPH